MSETKKMPTFPERIEELENKVRLLEQLAEKHTKEFLLSRQYTAALSEILNAMTETKTLDAKELTSFITKRKEEQAKAELEKQKEQLKEAVSKGLYAFADEVEEDSVLVGKEFNKEGKVSKEWSLTFYQDIDASLKEKVLGKKVGDVIDTFNNEKYEITEIYSRVLPEAPTSEPQGLVN